MKLVTTLRQEIEIQAALAWINLQLEICSLACPQQHVSSMAFLELPSRLSEVMQSKYTVESRQSEVKSLLAYSHHATHAWHSETILSPVYDEHWCFAYYLTELHHLEIDITLYFDKRSWPN